MISNYKIPGFLLVSLGGLFLSSGGALFKLFENQDVWTIYFWRSFFFTPAVLIFLFFTSKNQVIKKFKSLGLIGIVCGALYASGSGAYMFAMKYTTVANVLFILISHLLNLLKRIMLRYRWVNFKWSCFKYFFRHNFFYKFI